MKHGKTLRDPAELLAGGILPRDRVAELERVAARYAVAITPAIADLIDGDNADDPIARQFVPDLAELRQDPHEMVDPIGDDAHSPVAGVVHRYPDRVLLKLVNVCAVYCRFCFRREMVGPGSGALSSAEIETALDYIARHTGIWEVIFTGGDPLVLPAARLQRVAAALGRVEHVKVLRVHTRMPVADPDSITPELIAALKAFRKSVYLVLHANHAAELTPAVRAACARLVDCGIPMLSQSVLLRGVNDDPHVLGALMRALVESRVKPYYLHHCDLAPGTAHLRTTIADGQHLLKQLRGRLSGLCQPTYVLDIPGGHGKSPVGPCYLSGQANESEPLEVEDYRGVRHRYPAANGAATDSGTGS